MDAGLLVVEQRYALHFHGRLVAVLDVLPAPDENLEQRRINAIPCVDRGSDDLTPATNPVPAERSLVVRVTLPPFPLSHRCEFDANPLPRETGFDSGSHSTLQVWVIATSLKPTLTAGWPQHAVKPHLQGVIHRAHVGLPDAWGVAGGSTGRLRLGLAAGAVSARS